MRHSLLATLTFALLAASARADVVNIAADGSSLKIPPPWEITGPRFCPPGFRPLHGFRQGDIEADLCLGKTDKRDARALSRELLDELRKNLFRGKNVGDISEEAKLKGGISIWHFTYNTPPGFLIPGQPAAVMDAFFKRGKTTYFYIVTKPLKARDMKALTLELGAFEKAAKDSFRVLEQVSWR